MKLPPILCASFVALATLALSTEALATATACYQGKCYTWKTLTCKEIIANLPNSKGVTCTDAAKLSIGSTETIFNFDFTSEVPAPPYTNILFGAQFDAADPVSRSDDIYIFLYGDVNGIDLLQVRDATFCADCFSPDGILYGPITTASPLFDTMLDGVFSIGLQMISGTAELDSIFAQSLTGPDYGSTITIAASPEAIPEPNTLVLLAANIVVLAWILRRKRRFK